MVRALTAPLEKVDKITVISTGNAETTGMHKVTGDLAQVAAQVPMLFESPSGMSMGELLSKVRVIGDAVPKPSVPTR